MTLTARLTDDGNAVVLQGARWSDTFPVDQLGRKIEFYQELWSRGARKKGDPGPWARHYAPTLDALRDVARILRTNAGGRP